MPVAGASPSTTSTLASAGTSPAGRFGEALRRAEGARRPPPAAPARGKPFPPSTERPGELGPGGGAVARPPLLSAPPGIPELQAAVRSAPPAIAAALGGNGPAQLSLAFGAALAIDLRAGAQGLELSLRPAPTLERAARAELPRLVEALRARGLRVARAQVRGEGAAQAPARAR